MDEEDNVAVIKTPCEHRFHMACFISYVLSLPRTADVTCPMCREKLYARSSAPLRVPQRTEDSSRINFRIFIRIVMFALCFVILVYFITLMIT